MNWQTAVVLVIIVAAFAAIVIKAVLNKRKGKASCSCGGSCCSCPMSGKCH